MDCPDLFLSDSQTLWAFFFFPNKEKSTLHLHYIYITNLNNPKRLASSLRNFVLFCFVAHPPQVFGISFRSLVTLCYVKFLETKWRICVNYHRVMGEIKATNQLLND